MSDRHHSKKAAAPAKAPALEASRRPPAAGTSAPLSNQTVQHALAQGVSLPRDPAALGNRALLRLLSAGQARARKPVSSAHDPAELEADRLADRLVGGGCAACAGGAPCPSCAAGAHADGRILRKAEPGAPASADARAVKGELGAGRPLDPGSRDFFEPRLGVSLDRVRIHTDERAAASAGSVGALAYTLGSDVVFAPGRYQPHAPDGRRLLAHELVHVAQQAGTGAAPDADIHRQEAPPVPTATPQQPAPPATAASAEPAAAPKKPDSDAGPLRPSTDWYYFRGVAMSGDEAFMRGELRRLVARYGIRGADHWFDALQGRGVDVPLPFSAHARAFGGLRVRSPLDVQREMQNDAHRDAMSSVAVPLALRVYPEIRQEAVDFIAKFEKAMRSTLESVLGESEKRLESERIRYGVKKNDGAGGVTYEAKDTVAFQTMVGAAKDLLAIRLRIQALAQKQRGLTRSRGKGGSYVPDENRAAYDQLGAQMAEIEKEYAQARAGAALRHPILGAVLEDTTGDPTHTLSELAAGSLTGRQRGRYGGAPGAAGLIEMALDARQKNIQTVREKVDDKPERLWQIDAIVALTRAVVGTRQMTMADRVIDDEIKDRAFADTIKNIFLGAIALALAIPSGGGSLLAVGAAVAGAALSGYMLMENLSKYQLDLALTKTDLEKAQALATEEPSSFWVALDVVFFVVDGAAALKAVRGLRGVAKEAALAAEGAEAIEKAAQLEKAGEAVKPGLGKRLLESLAKLRQRPGAARALGAVGEAEGKAVAHAAEAIAKEAKGAETILHTAEHEVKVTRSGHIVVCSDCAWLRERFARELAENPALLKRAALAEEKAAAGALDTTAKAELAALTRELDAAQKARLAAELGPEGAKAAAEAAKAAKGPTALPKELEDAAGLAPKAKSPEEAIKSGESVPYKTSTTKGRGVKGDRLTGDHIPSRAALVQAKQEARYAAEEARLGRALRPAEKNALRFTRAEEDAIRDEALALVKGEDFHSAASRTFAGRNTAEQIAQDAKDLAVAVEKDFVADLSAIERAGGLTRAKVAEYIQHYDNLVKKGVVAYSDRINQVLLDYLKKAI